MGDKLHLTFWSVLERIQKFASHEVSSMQFNLFGCWTAWEEKLVKVPITSCLLISRMRLSGIILVMQVFVVIHISFHCVDEW